MKTQTFCTSLLLICVLSLSCSNSNEIKLIQYFDSFDAIREYEASFGAKEVPGSSDNGRIWFLCDAHEGLYRVSYYEIHDNAQIVATQYWTTNIASSVFFDTEPPFDLSDYPNLPTNYDALVVKLRNMESAIQPKFSSATSIVKMDWTHKVDMEGQVYSGAWSAENDLGYSYYDVTLTLMNSEDVHMVILGYKLTP